MVVDAVLDASSATAWYLAADNSQIDTVEYCYLDGAEGPYIESEPGFEVDGVSYRCRLDFAAKVVARLDRGARGLKPPRRSRGAYRGGSRVSHEARVD